jgi:hypothetical protein
MSRTKGLPPAQGRQGTTLIYTRSEETDAPNNELDARAPDDGVVHLRVREGGRTVAGPRPQARERRVLDGAKVRIRPDPQLVLAEDTVVHPVRA